LPNVVQRRPPFRRRRRFLSRSKSPASSITLTVPTTNHIFQREGVGAGVGRADLTIVGTYTGSPSAIEASWNGGGYVTVVSNPSGGAFTTKLPRQLVNSGTLAIRFTDDPSTNTSKSGVKVGDVYLLLGQSNGDGRGTNNQVYTGTSGWAAKLDVSNAWVPLTDPVGITGSSTGSPWPLLGNSVVGSGGVPVGFINCCVGGTSITTWLPGQTNYVNAQTRVAAAACKGIRAALWWQGESDAGMSRSTYLGHLRTVAAGVRADFGCKLIPCKLQDSTAISLADDTELWAAVGSAWEQEDDCETGPDFSGRSDDDGSYHFTTDASMSFAATGWYNALQTPYYTAAAGGGTGTAILAGHGIGLVAA